MDMAHTQHFGGQCPGFARSPAWLPAFPPGRVDFSPAAYRAFCVSHARRGVEPLFRFVAFRPGGCSADIATRPLQHQVQGVLGGSD